MPDNSENKVSFGLSKCYYAVITETVSNGVTTYAYASPVALPGAVSLNLEQQGSLVKFRADNVVFYASTSNDGYEGDIELARIPDSFLTDVFGLTITTTGKVLQESSDVEPKSFALLYQIEGDQDDERYVLYNCTATRPAIGSSTIGETKEPVTRSMTISAIPRADEDKLVFGRTTKDTPSATKTGWFSSVYVSDT